MFVDEYLQSNMTTVTSVPLATSRAQDVLGKSVPEKTPDTLLPNNNSSVSAKPNSVHSKLRTACYCNTTEITVLNVSELTQTFGQPPQDLTSRFATSYIADKYTILIPTYKRSASLLDVLDHYCNAANVHKILFIWHNVGMPIPDKVANYSNCKVPFKFHIPGHNLMSDRFKLTSDVETEGKWETLL